MIEQDKDGRIAVSELHGHTSSLDNNKYLNLKWVHPADDLRGYLLIKYFIQGETLAISLMDNEVVKNAIKEGSLKGTASEGNITEEQKKLQEFVLKRDKELFQEKSYLNRLSLPQQSPKYSVTNGN